MPLITRRSHPLLKELRELRDKPQNDLLFLEGPKLVEEALQARVPLKTLILSDAAKDSDVLKKARGQSTSVFTVTDSIFRSVSDLVEPQGVLAIGERPRWTWEQLFLQTPAPILVLDGLQNPGNVASMVRTAEAAGAAGVVTTPGTARLNSPKAIRGAMGSTFRVPSLEHIPIAQIADHLSRAGYRIYGTLVDAGTHHASSLTYTEVSWTHASAIVFGQEGGGLTDAWEAFIHETVTIPMRPPVESLNVAAAAAILLYEAHRQRHG